MLIYAKIRAVLVVIICVGLISIAATFYEILRAPTELTILTNPLEELEVHTHNTSRGDSLESKGHVEGVISEKVTLTHDTWITGMEIITNNAPMAVVHHMHLFAPERKDTYCPVMSEILMDVGQDAIPFGDFPKGYGIFLPKGTVIQVNAALHNPNPPLGAGIGYKNVSVGFKLRVDRFGSLRGLRPLSLHIVSLADTANCNATTFEVPAYTRDFVKTSSDNPASGSSIIIKRPGTIVAMGAHLHAWEGGKDLTVYLNDTPLKTFLPEKVGVNPDVWHTMPEYSPVRVVTGDKITLSSRYTNSFAVPLTGAMGMAAFFIHYDEH